MSDIHIKTIRRVPKPEKRPTRLNALVLWVLAMAGLLASALFSMPIYQATEGMNPHLQLLLANLLYYIPFIALPLLVLAKRRPGLYMAYRPNPISLFNVISIAILAMLGVYFVNGITLIWSIPLQKLGFDVFTSGLPATTSRSDLMLCVLYAAVLPGVCEEFLFRGAILPAFEEQGTRRAILVSSLMFMLVHGTVVGMPTQLLLGMLIAFLVFWTDSIYAGLVYHTVHNAFSIIISHMQGQTDAAQTGEIIELLGGMPGLVALAIEILVTGAMMWFSLRLFRLRGRLRGITEEPRQKNPLRNWDLILVLVSVIPCALLYFLDIAASTSFLGG